jgi:threonine aldolase
MYLHMDGARLANACAYLGCTLKEITADAGVDVLSFGGTKNGMMMGESVVAFRPEIAQNIKYWRKQSAQLASKMRYLSAQFLPYLDGLWLENASRANARAAELAALLAKYPQVELTQKPESNQIFCTMPAEALKTLGEHYFLYMWNEARGEARFVTSWDTTPEDIAAFGQLLKEIMNYEL